MRTAISIKFLVAFNIRREFGSGLFFIKIKCFFKQAHMTDDIAVTKITALFHAQISISAKILRSRVLSHDLHLACDQLRS